MTPGALGASQNCPQHRAVGMRCLRVPAVATPGSEHLSVAILLVKLSSVPSPPEASCAAVSVGDKSGPLQDADSCYS